MESIEVANICRALGDSSRLQIVLMLKEGEMCACKLLEAFAFTQPTLSHHMRILCASGLVICRREGKWCHYSINGEVLAKFSSFWLMNEAIATKDVHSSLEPNKPANCTCKLKNRTSN